MAQVDIIRANANTIKQLRNEGVTHKDIAIRYGVTIDVVKTFCKDNNIKTREQKNTEEEAAKRIHLKTGGRFIYVSGYTNKESNVNVKCRDCGEVFTRTYHHLTTRENGCPCCVARERKHNKDQQKKEQEKKQLLKVQLKIEREKEKEKKRLSQIHPCYVCGEITSRPKYCCDKCANKAANKARETRRRNLIKINMVDKDITVEGLFNRDLGVCYLCGRKCNYEDYTVRDGAFIAGDWYPSIDHVVPLAKGGEHSWANVRLAHHRCNWEKRDKII